MACDQCTCGREETEQEMLEAELEAWKERHHIEGGKVIVNDAKQPLRAALDGTDGRA